MPRIKRLRTEVVVQMAEELSTALKLLDTSREVVFYCDLNQAEALHVAVKRLIKAPKYQNYSFQFYKEGISSLPNTYAVVVRKFEGKY